MIDGGKGQVNAAQKALSQLGLNDVMIVRVSKGSDRKAGMKKLILIEQQQGLNITTGASAVLLIQQIRDEVHCFAMTGQRRGKLKQQLVLETIVGLGLKRQQIFNSLEDCKAYQPHIWTRFAALTALADN